MVIQSENKQEAISWKKWKGTLRIGRVWLVEKVQRAPCLRQRDLNKECMYIRI